MAQRSYWKSTSARPYVYDTVTSVFDDHCQRTPDKEAFIFYDENLQRTSITFREAREQSLNLAAGLLKTCPELQQGCRICIYTESKWEYLLAMLASFRLGLVAALANVDEHKEDKLLQVIDQTNCRGIIGDLSKMDTGVFEFLTKKENWICSVSEATKKNQKGAFGLIELMRIGRECEQTRNQVQMGQKSIISDSGAIIFFSSGTTGKPKAVLFSHFRILNGLCTYLDQMGYRKDDRYILDSPFSHATGFNLGFCFPACYGASSVIVSKKITVPSANARSFTFLSFIEKEKCTLALFFGFVIYDLVHEPEIKQLDLSSLKIVATGGQILSEENVTKLSSRFPNIKVHHMYALSECLIAVNIKKTNLLWMGITGNTEVKVIGQDNQVVPMNTPGEICVRSNTTMTGYIIDGKVQSGTDDEGWFHTDDNGIMNDSGELCIIGRMSDIIVRGPSNVPVRPLEDILDSHPKVKKSAIVPVPDPRLVYDLCACIIPSDPAVTETEVLEWCSLKFGDDTNGVNLRPKLCVILDEFPLSSVGKVSKSKLKELALNKLKNLNQM